MAGDVSVKRSVFAVTFFMWALGRCPDITHIPRHGSA
jgi:hypothetical protein